MSASPVPAALPEHRAVLEAVLAWSRAQPELRGAFLSGSGATGELDASSDLDLGFLCADAEARAALWERRWDWEVMDWKHRFDADHVKEHFVIWWFGAGIQTDMALYVPGELPPPEGAPYRVLWDASGSLEAWAEATRLPPPAAPDWSRAWHEDERFWAWTAYCARHVERGECYHIALEFHALRDLLETWEARLSGLAALPSRRTEQALEPARLAELGALFPRPGRAELRRALLEQIELYHRLRARVEAAVAVEWRVDPSVHDWVTGWVRAL